MYVFCAFLISFRKLTVTLGIRPRTASKPSLQPTSPVMRLVQDTHSGGLLLVACRPLYEQSVPNSDVYLHRETIARIFFEAFHLFADSSDVRVRKLPRHSKPP